MDPQARQQPDFSREETYLEMLALAQGVRPVTDFDELIGDFWPDEDNIEEFKGAWREWRREASPTGIGLFE